MTYTIPNAEEKASLFRERASLTRPKMSSRLKKKMVRLLTDVAALKSNEPEDTFLCIRLSKLLDSRPYFLSQLRYGRACRKLKDWVYEIMEKSNTLSSYLEKKGVGMGDFLPESRWNYRLLLIDIVLAELKR